MAVVKSVGVIGAGTMGRGMIKNLVQKGFTVWAYDISEEAMARADRLGALRAGSPAEAAAAAEVVVTSLTTPEVVREVVLADDGVLAALRAGGVIVDTSTIDPVTTRELAARAAERNTAFLDAPVSGGPAGADAGTLTIMVGGDRAAFDYAQPVLQAIGANIHHVGDSGSGQVAKLCHNMVVAVTTVVLGEVFLTGVKAGMDAATLAGIIAQGVGRSGTLEMFGPNIIHGTYSDALFRLSLMEKDARLFLRTAESLDVPTLLSQTAYQLYRAAKLNGKGSLDHTAVCQLLEELAACPIVKGPSPGAAGDVA